jgi:hypothetical protein
MVHTTFSSVVCNVVSWLSIVAADLDGLDSRCVHMALWHVDHGCATLSVAILGAEFVIGLRTELDPSIVEALDSMTMVRHVL